MGVRNHLIEGVSGTGKSAVCEELRRRGYAAVNGDRELAYQGDPETGEPTQGFTHEHHIWHIDTVESLIADRHEAVMFFCGGSRNFHRFIDLFDEIIILEVDADTLMRRLSQRTDGDWGSQRSERDLIQRLHRTREDLPLGGIVIDATAPLTRVVDEIIRQTLS